MQPVNRRGPFQNGRGRSSSGPSGEHPNKSPDVPAAKPPRSSGTACQKYATLFLTEKDDDHGCGQDSGTSETARSRLGFLRETHERRRRPCGDRPSPRSIGKGRQYPPPCTRPIRLAAGPSNLGSAFADPGCCRSSRSRAGRPPAPDLARARRQRFGSFIPGASQDGVPDGRQFAKDQGRPAGHISEARRATRSLGCRHEGWSCTSGIASRRQGSRFAWRCPASSRQPSGGRQSWSPEVDAQGSTMGGVRHRRHYGIGVRNR